MTDHLPECLSANPSLRKAEAPMYGLLCICSELRACEKRVRMEDDDYAYVAVQAEADGRRRGWNEALDAAREAVVGLKKYVEFPSAPVNYIHPDFFIAAIDALREEKK